MLDRRRRKDGFTVVEMALVVSIMGIIVLIATASYSFAVANSRSIACRSNQRVLGEAARVFTAEHGSPPDSLEDLDPYVRGSHSLRCPSDVSVRLEWDPDSESVTCRLHPNE